MIRELEKRIGDNENNSAIATRRANAGRARNYGL
jgi:hypothetical protein